MKKLGINTAAGVLDIIASITYFFAIFIIVGEVLSSGTGGSATVILLFGVVCLAVHIYAMIKSKQAGMKTTGHILGIVGHGLYVVLGALMGIPAMILCILAAVFTLINNKVV